MSTEIELKFRIGPGQMPEVASKLRASAGFGRYALRAANRQRQTDSYFDVNGALRERNASLRMREAGDSVFITYKGPKAMDRSEGTQVRPEIQNDGLADLPDRFAEIVACLRSVGALDAAAAQTAPNLARDGLVPSLDQLGLRPLFRVVTDRQVWLIERDGTRIAELALDQSQFHTETGANARMNQLEIELTQPADAAVMAELRATATDWLGLRPDDTTKAERGWGLYVASDKRDKVEAKVQLRKLDHYYDMGNKLRGDHGYFEGYTLVGEGITRELRDVYYDTERLALAKKRAYLRIRTDGSQSPPVRELTLRQIATSGKHAYLQQTEHKTRLDQPDAAAVWNEIQRVLRHEGVIGNPRPATGAIADSIEERMAQLGLRVSLEAEIDRTSWAVDQVKTERAPADRYRARATIAKIKLDLVNFKNPSVTPPDVHQYAEVEVTGVEDESTSPDRVEMAAYTEFVEVFCRRLQTGRPYGGTKYLSGLHRVAAPHLRAQLPPERSDIPVMRLIGSPPIDARHAQRAFSWLAVLFAGFTASAIVGVKLDQVGSALGHLVQGPLLTPAALFLMALPYVVGATLFVLYRTAVTSIALRLTLASLLAVVLVAVGVLGPNVGASVVAIIGLAVAVLPLFGIDFVRRLSGED